MGIILNKFYKNDKSKIYHDLEDICSICHQDFTKHNYIVLNCGHTFHASCIFNSMYHNYKKCPMCRNKIKYRYHKPQVFFE